MNRIRNFKTLTAVVAIALLLTVAVGGTIAWLAASTEPVVNVFTPGSVPPSVVEEIDNDTKNSIQVENTGNVDAYIRVAIVANWCNDEGEIVGPYTGTIEINETYWFEKGDYYYYRSRVLPGAQTYDLLADDTEIARGNIPTAYPTATTLKMTVITQSIQADGTTTVNGTVIPVVTAEWGVTVGDDGTISAS